MINNNWLEENFTKTEKHLYKIKNIIINKKTKFQNVSILELENYKKTLVLDGEIQSTELDEFIYHESIVHPTMLLHNNPENILILGGGEGATLREILKYKSVKNITMIDIDEEVIDFCKNNLLSFHKNSFFDKKVNLIIKDAKIFIQNTNEKFDIIISDLCSPIANTSSEDLYTQNFYKSLKILLNDQGILIVQSTPCDIPEFKLFSLIHNTLKSVFKNIYPFSSFVPSCIFPWGYNIATDNNTNPLNIDIDNLLEQKLILNDLKYYDSITHKKMFLFPKHLRKLLNKEKGIITENSLYFLFK